MTLTPGMNLSESSFGVVSVCMNMERARQGFGACFTNVEYNPSLCCTRPLLSSALRNEWMGANIERARVSRGSRVGSTCEAAPTPVLQATLSDLENNLEAMVVSRVAPHFWSFA